MSSVTYFSLRLRTRTPPNIGDVVAYRPKNGAEITLQVVHIVMEEQAAYDLIPDLPAYHLTCLEADQPKGTEP